MKASLRIVISFLMITHLAFSMADSSPPTLNCPGPTIMTDNDKGTNVSTVNWSFSFNDNSLNQPGTTKDSFTIELTINGKNVDRNLPKLMGIGSNTVKYTVTDAAKNSASCYFTVEVRDTEPPTCSFCPADIHIDDADGATKRVSWNRPICSDNSGNIPMIVSNKAPGSIFDVPGSYVILYTVSDGSNNVNKDCSFRITLKKKQCPLYEPPKNGALVCIYFGSEPLCQVQCKEGYDFAFTPPLVYYCSGGKWNFLSFSGYNNQLPWPDCKVANSPQKIMNFPNFYFTTNSGDYCDDSNVQASVKSNFMDLMMSKIPFFCTFNPAGCTVDAVKTYCKGQRKRKRAVVKLLIPQDFPRRRGVIGRA